MFLSGKAMFVDELEDSQQQNTDHSSAAPEAEPLPIDLDSFSGTYTNPGYGAVIFCTAQSTSHHCLTVLDSFGPFIGQTPFPSPIPVPAPAPIAPELYAVWPRLWSSHVRLTHRAAADFDLQFTTLFPHGYGANTTAFETAQSGESDGQVVFVLEGEGAEASVVGFGMELDADAVEARKRAGATDVRDWADAWFEKL